jgi:hypothetical protein
MTVDGDPNLDSVIQRIASAFDVDVYLFSGAMQGRLADRFIETLRNVPKKRKNVALVLTTDGGSADSAYHMTRCLKRYYDKFILYVFGYCKSAGTLVAIGADEIVMSEFGQFGPLDVQLSDKNELFGQTPALDVSQSIATLSNTAFEFFTDHFFGMSPGRGVNTKTAVDIAKCLTLGIIEPIASQIDPLLLGRVDRSMKIAHAYGLRLNPNFTKIEKLIEGYPSHNFVIDFEEASTLFPNVREPNSDEIKLESFLRAAQCVPFQHPKNIVKFFESATEHPDRQNDKKEESHAVSKTDGAHQRRRTTDPANR